MTSNITENSRAVAMEFMQAMMRRDIDRAAELFHEDGIFWVPGRKAQVPFAGSYNRDQFIEIERNAGAHSDGDLNIEVTGVTAEEDRVAIEVELRTTNSQGETYEQDYHHLFVIKDDKVFLWKEYMDTQMNAEHFKSLTPPE